MSKCSSRLLTLCAVLMFSLTCLAQTKTPQINSINPLTQEASPVVEILGKGFGKELSAVKVLINDTGNFATVIGVKNKKVTVQIPGNNLCTGDISLRVLVNTTASNAAKFNYYKGLPELQGLNPTHALPGAVLQITAANLSCDMASNTVTFNGRPAQILGVSGEQLTVRVPDMLNGIVNVQVIVANHTSLAEPFTVDTSGSSGNNNGESANTYTFTNTGPSLTGFSPVFNLTDKLNVNGYETNLWYVNFYGTQQAIVDAPWKTITGQQQKALVTIDSRYSYLGSIGSTNGRYVYVLVQYPKHPELPFNESTNYFFWGSFALVSEGSPNGDVTFNSSGKGGAGVDSFVVTKDLTGSNKMSMTAVVVAPDLGGYADYGKNYALAGDGKVNMPKLTKVTMNFTNITPRVPIAYYNLGDVTMTDMTGQYGAISTTQTEFKAKLAANDITFFYPFF